MAAGRDQLLPNGRGRGFMTGVRPSFCVATIPGTNVCFGSKADIGTGTRVSPSTQQLRQPGDIGRDPPRFIAREQFRRRS